LSRKLKVGENFSLPIETVTSTTVIYGGKGMGKTNLGSVLVEELDAAGLRWCALDPLGVWWGLRHSADGKGKGVECLILGGTHGDIPIEPTGGAIVADLVVDESANVIIDFSRRPNGQMWSIGEKIQFITDYTYRLFQRQGELVGGRRREPIFQLLDEAARYIPQTIRAGDAKMALCVAAWEQMVEEGRNIGIGVGLLTQRSARMAKSVSEVADAVIAFRIVGPNSIGAITDWLGEHVPKAEVNAMVEKIRKLDVGTALVVSPGWLQFEGVVRFRQRRTFDSSATPKPGERGRKVTGSGAKPDLAKYAQRMAATIERAKENDPRELKKQLAELKKELTKKSAAPSTSTAAAPDPEKLKAQITRAVESAIKKRDTSWTAAVRKYRKEVMDSLATSFNKTGFVPPDEKIAIEMPATSLTAPAQREFKHAAYGYKPGHGVGPLPVDDRKPAKTPSTQNGHSSSLPVGEKSVLRAIAQYEGGAERDQLSVLTGYKRSSRDAYIQRLREKGFVDVAGNSLTATQAGIDALGSDYEPLPTGVDLQQYWLNKLPEGEKKILKVLLDAGGSAISRDNLDELTGYKRSSRDAYIQRLSARRIVENVGRGEIKAAKELF
jgi:hypothetical protein